MDENLPGGARVIVGVDESAAARLALAWAIGTVRLRRMPLVAVHVARAPIHAFPEALPVQHAARAGDESRSADVVNAAFDEVAGGLPHDVHTVIVGRMGDPGYHLVELAHEGDLLVLGRSHRSLLSRVLLPSTSMYCARHARATVVIVREPAPPEEPPLSASRTRRFWSK
ncbi:universal stress protein [Nonomuraea longicatena]|uniref:UspA domain-containing protein n=1 Tax=Nonomuraea longicatena TaxID=83682 RepID=A0ABN1R856_9ACTN